MNRKRSVLITREIVDFLLSDRFPPKKVRKRAINHIIDGIAVMLAGSRSQCSRMLFSYVQEKRGKRTSSLLGFTPKVCASDAALVNGTSGHADDYDDTQYPASSDRIYGLLTHPTVPVLAASLAVGEDRRCSGVELLAAYVAGFEVECKLAEAINPEHYRKGFHTTGTIGVFGATAASSKILKLREEELKHAIGIAASMSCGIRANFGTMTKPLHAGMAASNGVMAAMLAQKGFTADPNALDGPWGFMSIFGNGADSEKVLCKMGKPYALIDPGASIKIFPCASLAQPSMSMLLDIVTQKDLSPRIYAKSE